MGERGGRGRGRGRTGRKSRYKRKRTKKMMDSVLSIAHVGSLSGLTVRGERPMLSFQTRDEHRALLIIPQSVDSKRFL